MNWIPIFTLAVAGFQGNLLTGGGPSLDEFITTDKQAFLVLPPTPVGSGQTVYMDWSPSGRYLLIGEMRPRLTPAFLTSMMQGVRPPQGGVALSVWDKTSGKTVELGVLPKYMPMKAYGSGPKWLGSADVAVDIFVEDLSPAEPGQVERASLLKIDLVTKQFQMLPLANPIPDGTFYELYASPSKPHALIVERKYLMKDPAAGRTNPQFWAAAWMVDAAGRHGKKSETLRGSIQNVRWLANEGKVGIDFMQVEEGRAEKQIRVMDLATGKLESVATLPPVWQPKEVQAPLHTILLPNQTAAGTVKRSVMAAWLRSATPSDQSEYLLSARADSAEINSTADAVACLDQGVLTVRQLASVPLEMYLRAKEAAERTKAISNAKQIATGLIIYSTDHQDQLPTGDEFSSGALSPYLKNSGLLTGFVYTFKGGSVNSIENPAGTMLGYIPVAGGFAVAFADGHVKWSPQLPK